MLHRRWKERRLPQHGRGKEERGRMAIPFEGLGIFRREDLPALDAAALKE